MEGLLRRVEGWASVVWKGVKGARGMGIFRCVGKG